MIVDSATELLDDFRALPNRVERPRTFMEIANYTHYEDQELIDKLATYRGA